MRPERQPRLLGSASGPQAGEWGAAGQGVGACRAPVGAGQHGATETWGSCHVEEADARRDTHTHTKKRQAEMDALFSDNIVELRNGLSSRLAVLR